MACAFLTNHARVLLVLANNADIRLREIADTLDLTERTVHRLIDDLDDAGYITRQKNGRNSTYTVEVDEPQLAQLADAGEYFP